MKLKGIRFINLLNFSFDRLTRAFEFEDLEIEVVESEESGLSVYFYTDKEAEHAKKCFDEFDDDFYLDSELCDVVNYNLRFKEGGDKME